MSSSVARILHVASLVITSLIVGAMFGVWRGYDPTLYSPATFVEVQQGAIRGLNDLLPAMGLSGIVLVAMLGFLARKRPRALWLYVAAGGAFAAAGMVTRFGNQPINELVMTWGATPPDGWQALRDTWWNWHLARLAVGLVGEVLLINAIFADRGQMVGAPSRRSAGVVGRPA